MNSPIFRSRADACWFNDFISVANLVLLYNDIPSAGTARQGRLGPAARRLNTVRYRVPCYPFVIGEHILSPYYLFARGGHDWRAFGSEFYWVATMMVHEYCEVFADDGHVAFIEIMEGRRRGAAGNSAMNQPSRVSTLLDGDLRYAGQWVAVLFKRSGVADHEDFGITWRGQVTFNPNTARSVGCHSKPLDRESFRERSQDARPCIEEHGSRRCPIYSPKLRLQCIAAQHGDSAGHLNSCWTCVRESFQARRMSGEFVVPEIAIGAHRQHEKVLRDGDAQPIGAIHEYALFLRIAKVSADDDDVRKSVTHYATPVAPASLPGASATSQTPGVQASNRLNGKETGRTSFVWGFFKKLNRASNRKKNPPTSQRV